MPLFAVSLFLDCRVAGSLEPDVLHELAIHMVRAQDEDDARARGTELGTRHETTYRNADGDEVSWVFQRVVECQELLENELADGMEVSSWLYRGECLCLNDGWSAPTPQTD